MKVKSDIYFLYRGYLRNPGDEFEMKDEDALAFARRGKVKLLEKKKLPPLEPKKK